MKILILKNSLTGEERIYKTNCEYNLNNNIKNAILKSANSVYNAKYDQILYT